MPDQDHGYRLVICNCPPESAAQLADRLVEEKLAACVNIVPGVESVYRWQGKICHDRESTLLVKTRAALLPALTRRIVELHPYEVPEVVSVTLNEDEGEARYFRWIDEVTE